MKTETVTVKRADSTQLRNAFTDLFRPLTNWFNEHGWDGALTTPAVNIKETEQSYNLLLAAPGLKKEDFRIDIYGNQLTISAEREEETEEKNEQYGRKEYNYSSFRRLFTLPDEVATDKIEAVYTEGELQLTLPKNGASKKNIQTITVK